VLRISRQRRAIGFVLHKKCPGAPKFSADSTLMGKKGVFDGFL
jgi:hypothetical protein